MGSRIRQGDTVEVISGNDRGVRGVVQRVLPKKNHVVVAGVNIVKKHQSAVRAGRGQAQAGIIEFEASIDASNVALVCSRCDERARVGNAPQEGAGNARVCKKCGEVID